MAKLIDLLYSLTEVIIRYHDIHVSEPLVRNSNPNLLANAYKLKSKDIIATPDTIKDVLDGFITSCTVSYPERKPLLRYLTHQILFLNQILAQQASFSDEQLAHNKVQLKEMFINFRELLTTKKSNTYWVNYSKNKPSDPSPVRDEMHGVVKDAYFEMGHFCDSGSLLDEIVMGRFHLSTKTSNDEIGGLVDELCDNYQNTLFAAEKIELQRQLELAKREKTEQLLELEKFKTISAEQLLELDKLKTAGTMQVSEFEKLKLVCSEQVAEKIELQRQLELEKREKAEQLLELEKIKTVSAEQLLELDKLKNEGTMQVSEFERLKLVCSEQVSELVNQKKDIIQQKLGFKELNKTYHETLEQLKIAQIKLSELEKAALIKANSLISEVRLVPSESVELSTARSKIAAHEKTIAALRLQLGQQNIFRGGFGLYGTLFNPLILQARRVTAENTEEATASGPLLGTTE